LFENIPFGIDQFRQNICINFLSHVRTYATIAGAAPIVAE
jgi:hypothetical protein